MPLRHMELRHLRYFVSVAEQGSVSKAAQQVHVSQPALSRQIRDLEAELGVQLFDRVGRRVELTAEGEDLLRHCRDVLAQAESVRERARALHGGVVGVLRVGAPPQTTQSILAGFLVRYRRRVWLENHLRQARAVTQVHKHHPPMVSPAVHPATEDRFLAHVGRS